MEKFRVRPGYHSQELLVEFWGDHRGEHFPNVSALLANALGAEPLKHPTIDTAMVAATDEFISYWRYAHGEYELVDDIWAFFIHAPENNLRVITDIERALLASGLFVKEDVDFSEYR